MTTFPEPQLALALQPLRSDNIVMQDFCVCFDGHDILVIKALVLHPLHIDNIVMRDSVLESLKSNDGDYGECGPP